MCNLAITDKSPCYALLQIIKEPSAAINSTSLSTQTEINQVTGLPFEYCEKKCLEILKQHETFNIQVIFIQIETEFGPICSQYMFVFIRALVTAVCRHCSSESLDENRFTVYCPLLKMFINGNKYFEIDALLAIQALQQKMQYKLGNHTYSLKNKFVFL